MKIMMTSIVQNRRAKPKKMSLTIELKSLTKEKMFKEVNYA